MSGLLKYDTLRRLRLFAGMACFVVIPLTGVTACTALQLGGPANVASSTTADERAALAIELAYKAARTAVELAVDNGLISTPEQKKVWRERNRRAYAAVQKVEAGYTAANGAEASAAITALLNLTGKDPK